MAVKQVQEERNRNKGHTIVEPLLKPSWKGALCIESARKSSVFIIAMLSVPSGDVDIAIVTHW